MRVVAVRIVVALGCVASIATDCERSTCDVDDCRTRCLEEAAALGEPVPAPTVTTVNCEQTSLGDENLGDACLCAVGDGVVETVHGDQAFQECAVRGHAGACVFETREFAGCTNGVNESCDPTCAELETRLVADAQTTFDVELASARCMDLGDALPGRPPSQACECIFQLEGECFTSPHADRVACPGF